LPLYLSGEHFARELCERCLQAAWCRVVLEQVKVPDPALVDEAVWHVLPALMNSTAVALASGDLHMSDVALRGYSNVHRLMLAVCSSQLKTRAAEAVRAFVEDPLLRLKADCPNLGHLLPRLLLLDDPLLAWHSISEALLVEAVDRTVLHAYRDFPRLSSAGDAQYVRMRWESASKGLRMLLFAVRFLRQSAEWGSPSDVAAHYDERYGQASSSEQEALRADVKSILVVNSWEAFSRCWCASEGVDVNSPSFACRLGQDALVELLRESERNSLCKGYHSRPMRRLRWFCVAAISLVVVVFAVCLRS